MGVLLSGKMGRDWDVLELVTKRSRNDEKLVICPVCLNCILIFSGNKQSKEKCVLECVKNLGWEIKIYNYLRKIKELFKKQDWKVNFVIKNYKRLH